jgi:hypothetical protein
MVFKPEPRPCYRVEALESRVLLSFGALGSELRVNTYTAGDQSAPAVACDAAGDSIVTWQSLDQDGSNYGVYAQRYSAAGIAEGGAFQVNSYTASVQGLPSVAMDAAGDFVIVWQSYGEDGSGFGIYAKRYNAAGVEQPPPAGVTRGAGNEFQVNTYTTNAQENPTVAMDSAGGFVITWQCYGEAGGGLGVYAKRYNAAGAEQSPPAGATRGAGNEFQVNTYTTGTQENPSVAMDSAGDFVIAWGSFQDGDRYGIYVQQYNAAGVATGAEFPVSTYTTSIQDLPSAAMDSAGDFVIVWQSNSEDSSGFGVYAKRYDAAGIEQAPPTGVTRGAGNEFQVNTSTAGPQSNPRVAMDSTGDFVIAWQSVGQDGGGYAIKSRQYNPTGIASVVDRVTNTQTASNQINPCVAMDSASDFLAAWESNDRIGYGIYAQWNSGIAPTQLVFLQQPAATTAGTPVASAVTVAVEDDSGNTVTTDVSTVTLALNSGTFAGNAATISAAVVNGVATFTGLTIDTASSYTLAAADGSLPSTTSSSFTVSPDAPSQLAFTNQPSNTVGGSAIAPAVTVAVEDQYGNVVTSDSTSTVTVTLHNGTFADNTTTETAAVVNGVATFSGLTIDTDGSYTLSATDGSLAGATSSAFTIDPAAASKLVITNEPSNTTAGSAISRAVTVAVEDRYGNVVPTDSSTVTASLSTGTFADGSTTETAADVDGVATFSGLTINRSGSYSLAATDGSLTGATSPIFTIDPAAPSKLLITSEPSNTPAGTAISPAVSVTIEDQYNNVVSTDSSTVTVSLSSGTFADGSAIETAADLNGVATFSGLTINTDGNYSLAATDGSLTGANSSSFTIGAAVASQLVITGEPSNTTAGNAISPAVTVAVEDQYGNVVPSDSSTVTVFLSTGTFADGGTTETTADVNGVATFAGLTIDTAGSYTLSATDGSLTGATSSAFTIDPAPASKLVITNEPSNTTAGTVISPAVTVAVEDQYGNVVSTDSSTVTVSLSSGTFADGSTTETAADVNGIATFAGLAIDTPGSYSLIATGGSLTGANSSSFTIDPATASKLVITNEPSNTAAGDAVSPAVTVAVEDQYNNVASADASTVTLSLSTGTFADGSTTETAADVNGVATFSGLTIDTAGSYTLSATDGSLTGATSSAFTIDPATTNKLVITNEPSNTAAGNAISPSVTVAVEDRYGNVVPTDSSTATMSLSTGTFADGSATETAPDVNGVATFSGLTIDAAGSYTLGATDGALAGATSSSFSVSPAAPSQLVVTTEPSNANAGAAIAPAVAIAVEDQYGNVVSSDASTVTVSLSSGTFADGSATETAADVNGVATFSSLSINAAGTYTLAATDGSLTRASSSSFTIDPAAPSSLVITNEPSNATAGAAISPAVTVAVEDQYNDVVSSDVSTVTLSLSSGTFADGGTTETAADVDGVATFSGLTINAAGNYSLTATDGSLAGANSSSFTIGVAPASQLVVSDQPSNTMAGSAISPSVMVSVEDLYGNVVPTDASTLTLSLSTGTFADGSTTEAAADVDGVATFSALTIDTAGSYTLSATDGSLTGATSSAFTIGAAAASQLVVTGEPSDTTAGAAISPAVAITVEDQYGNVVSIDASTVTVSLSTGTFADGSTTETAADVNGVATFSGLTIDAAGSYSLAATDGSLTGANSSSFTISAAPASQLVVTGQPPNTIAGNAISPAVSVAVEDQYGNVVSTDASTVTLSLSSGTFADGSTTETAADVNGVATFSGLTINAAGSYSLAATDGSLTGANSSSFTIGAAAASQLVLTGEPSDTTAGAAISPAVTVAVEDQYNNVVSTDASTVTVSLSTGTFADGSTTENAADVNGVATFAGLTIDTAGSYSLAATDGSLTGANSSSFTIGAAAASQLVVTGQPSDANSGTAISPAVAVAVEDQYSNVVSSDGSTVTASLSAATFSDGQTIETAIAINGMATFSALTIATPGTYTLGATDGSLSGATSNAFSINLVLPDRRLGMLTPKTSL